MKENKFWCCLVRRDIMRIFFVKPRHFLSWLTRNSFLQIREKTGMKTPAPKQWLCLQILMLPTHLTYSVLPSFLFIKKQEHVQTNAKWSWNQILFCCQGFFFPHPAACPDYIYIYKIILSIIIKKNNIILYVWCVHFYII